MEAVEARIPTESAERYLAQLCRHASAISGGGAGGGHMRMMRHTRHGAARAEHGSLTVAVEQSERAAVIRLEPYGRCELTATEAELLVRIEAVGELECARIRQIVTNDLTRFGGRHTRLEISWLPAARDEDAAGAAEPV